MQSEHQRHVIRGRGYLIWGLRWNGFVLALWLTLATMRATVALAIWSATLIWFVWTVRPRVEASVEGIRIKGMLSSTWIPSGSIQGLSVQRDMVLWYRTIHLYVEIRGSESVRVRWVSWVPWFESFLTVEPPDLPRPQQQKAIDGLTAALDPSQQLHRS